MLRRSCCSQCPFAWKEPRGGDSQGKAGSEGFIPCCTYKPHKTALHTCLPEDTVGLRRGADAFVVFAGFLLPLSQPTLSPSDGPHTLPIDEKSICLYQTVFLDFPNARS